MRKIIAINSLFSFIAACLSVMVPLYMLEMKVDIALVGLILAFGPLSFMVLRLIFASVADQAGTRLINLIYSASNLAATLLYILVPTQVGFAAGAFFEGVRNSGFWAVIRTDILSSSKISHINRTLARYSAIRQLADGGGRLAAGFLLSFLAFQGSFSFLFVLGAILLAILLSLPNKTPLPDGNSVLKRIFTKRGRTFWHASLLMVFGWLPYNMLLAFILPLYLVSGLGLSYLETAGMIALLSLAIAAFSFASMRWNLSRRWLLLIVLAAVAGLIMFPYSGQDVLLPLLLVAIGLGCNNVINEYILMDQVIRSRDISTDIGVLNTPLRLGEIIFLSLGGIAITIFGFSSVFFACAFLLFGFTVSALRSFSDESGSPKSS